MASTQPEGRSATSYNLTIGGSTFNQPKNDGVEQMVMEDHVDMVEVLTVRLGGGETTPKWEVNIGDPVELKAGAGTVVLFKGEVTGVEPSWTADGLMALVVHAKDNAHRLARGRKTRFFENKKDSEIAQTVGSASKLSVDADPTTEVHAYTLQRNESDLAFLKRIAARNNFQVTVDEGKLIFKKASFSGTATEITMGKNLRSAKLHHNSQEMASEVIVRGWDPRTKTEIVGKASASDVETIGGGTNGAEMATQKFGDNTAYITDVPISSQAQANELAKAEMNRIARQFAKGSCTVEGNDAIRAGTSCEMGGLSQGFNGKVYVISSRHIITAHSGYLTEFTFISNTTGT